MYKLLLLTCLLTGISSKPAGTADEQETSAITPMTTTMEPKMTKTMETTMTTTIEPPNVPKCPTGFVPRQAGTRHMCYRFSCMPFRNWTDAQSWCQRIGGYLAEPNTTVEVQAVKNLTTGSDRLPLDAWLGGKYSNEGVWMWDHSNSPVPNYLWARGQPDDVMATGQPDDVMATGQPDGKDGKCMLHGKNLEITNCSSNNKCYVCQSISPPGYFPGDATQEPEVDTVTTHGSEMSYTGSTNVMDEEHQ